MPQNGVHPMSRISAASMRKSWLTVYDAFGSSMRSGRARVSQCDTVDPSSRGRVAYMYICPCPSAPTNRVASASSVTDSLLTPVSRTASALVTPMTGMWTGNIATWLGGSSSENGGSMPLASEIKIASAPPDCASWDFWLDGQLPPAKSTTFPV